MQTTNQDELEEVRAEHSERVFERYQTKSKSFRNWFSALVGFALVFFLIISFPYFLLQCEQHKINERLENLTVEITQKEESSEPYRQAKDGIKELRGQIENGPLNLRSFILSLEKGTKQESQQTLQQDPRISLVDEDWLNNKVRLEILNEFRDYRRILSESVIMPLQALDTESAAEIDLTELERQLDSLQANFEKKLDDNPRFWNTFEEKEVFYIEIEEEVESFWSEYGSAVESRSQKLEWELIALQTAKAELEEQQTQLSIREKEVANRLDQIESPIGKLPVGLNESVLVFPPLLAIGFWICTSLFCETMRIRKVFHELYQKKDPDQVILTDQQVALIAPLWIDPVNPEQNKIIHFTMILLPFVIFSVACSLIIYGWIISDPFSSTAQLNRWVYTGFYVIGLGIFMYGFWRVIVELRRYVQ